MSELAEEKRLASIKQAEVLSVVGAGVLGAGLALLAPAALGPYVYWLIGVGVAVHGLGMTMKHRLERERRVQPRWERVLFGACWLALVLLMAALLLGVVEKS